MATCFNEQQRHLQVQPVNCHVLTAAVNIALCQNKKGRSLKAKTNVEFCVINLQRAQLTCQSKLLGKKEYLESQL